MNRVFGPALALVTAGAAACAPTPTVSHGNEIGGYVDLVDALRAAGATVEPVREIEQSFFSVPGQVITVSGGEVQVFEYADEATREVEAAMISADGSSIGTTMITWVEPPHFYAMGRAIALYVGSDAEILQMLESVLGEPIAEGVAPAPAPGY